MQYTRIDSFDITFPDCSARIELKVCEKRKHLDGRSSKKGTGEKRLYCGANMIELDIFFGFDGKDDKSAKKFFILKDDLRSYYEAIEKEYKIKSTYKYSNRSTLQTIYEEYSSELNDLNDDVLELEFVHSFDSQNRYYIEIDRSKNNKNKDKYYRIWDYIRNICLPRVSRLLFMKLENTSGETTFYIKPFYGAGIFGKGNVSLESKMRGGQAKYRDSIFNKYKECVVTGVSNPKLLVACHILPYSECKENKEFEQYKFHVQNGFLMTPTVHRLFDLGYLSFSEIDGKIIFSEYLLNSDRENLHLDKNKTVDVSDEDLKNCLIWHNRNIFLKASSKLELNK